MELGIRKRLVFALSASRRLEYEARVKAERVEVHGRSNQSPFPRPLRDSRESWYHAERGLTEDRLRREMF